MKLCKEICKKCWINQSRERALHKWSEADDTYWKDGKVLCPIGGGLLIAGVNEDVRDWCPYKMEHTVCQ